MFYCIQCLHITLVFQFPTIFIFYFNFERSYEAKMPQTLDNSLELHRLLMAKHRLFMVQFAGTQTFMVKFSYQAFIILRRRKVSIYICILNFSHKLDFSLTL